VHPFEKKITLPYSFFRSRFNIIIFKLLSKLILLLTFLP